MRMLDLVSINETKLQIGNAYQVKYHINDYNFTGILSVINKEGITFIAYNKDKGIEEIHIDLITFITDISEIIFLSPVIEEYASECVEESYTDSDTKEMLNRQYFEDDSNSQEASGENIRTIEELTPGESINFDPIEDYQMPSSDNYRFDFS